MIIPLRYRRTPIRAFYGYHFLMPCRRYVVSGDITALEISLAAGNSTEKVLNAIGWMT